MYRLFFILILACMAAAPASGPSTRPLITRNNPIDALLYNTVVMARNHTQEIRAGYDVNTDEERALMEANVQLAGAMEQLRSTAEIQYGPDGFANIGFGPMFERQIEMIRNAVVTIRGEEAYVYLNRSAQPSTVLVRVDGQWRISPARTFGPEIGWRTARILGQAQAYKELASEIAGNRYRLAADARTAGTQKVQAALQAVDSRFAATRPATTRASE